MRDRTRLHGYRSYPIAFLFAVPPKPEVDSDVYISFEEGCFVNHGAQLVKEQTPFSNDEVCAIRKFEEQEIRSCFFF